MTSKLFKLLLWLLALLLVIYLGICGYMYGQQRKMIYQGGSTRVSAEQTNFSLQRPDVLLRGWQIHPAEAAQGAVIYFGGNAENIERRLPQFAAALPRSDIYMLAYRGYGASGGEPTEALLEADAMALFDEVRRLHPQAPITVVGRSLGTGVASAVAEARQPTKLVLVTPFDSILNTVRGIYGWLPVELLLKDRFDSAARLQNYGGPILVLRAGMDQVVEPARTDALLERLKGKAVQVQQFELAGHSSIFRAAGFWPAIARFASNTH
ncbi:alpha/beta hydrolase [Comamonas testosteroni]|uniref:Alpha/beta hydrolase n=1 Tax=Comamonas testosteroni TaxID=285 RepID=A0A373FDL6_COMTE|nr:alpha/beta hydrolase [Comamonas testosteroni]RGE42087.1 alpha/beta hydrolase [Comamonas testosteroni]